MLTLILRFKMYLASLSQNPMEWDIMGREVLESRYRRIYTDNPFWMCVDQFIHVSLFFLLRAPSPIDIFRRQYGYVPFDVIDPSSTGRQTREGSRTIEVSLLRHLSSWFTFLTLSQYAFEDFSIRQVSLLLNNTANEETYLNRSLVDIFFCSHF